MIITVDGQSSTGKSSLAFMLAKSLSYKFLGSGSLYRLVAYAKLHNIDIDKYINRIQDELRFELDGQEMRIMMGDNDMTTILHGADITKSASRLAKEPVIRKQLYNLQRYFNRPPGLVAEGRDMGTVIFPEADIKFFLRANLDVRVRRRQKQLLSHGIERTIDDIMAKMSERDHQDENRPVSPLLPADDAIMVDTDKSIEDILAQMLMKVDYKSRK